MNDDIMVSTYVNGYDWHIRVTNTKTGKSVVAEGKGRKVPADIRQQLVEQVKAT